MRLAETVKLAERGIVYIDGTDKFSNKDAAINYASGGSSINVQTGILKMAERFDIPNMENAATCIITKDTLTTKVPVLTEAESASDSISGQGVFWLSKFVQCGKI